MSAIKRVGDLEINQDLAFQRKEWLVERIGWVTMLILAIAALLGLFSQGPISDATAKDGALQLGYGRFERLLAPAHWKVFVDPQQISNGEVRLQVDRDLISSYNVEQITPEPESTELLPDQIIYTFKVDGEQQPLEVTFDLQANLIGTTRGKIGIENGPMVKISQFIYP